MGRIKKDLTRYRAFPHSICKALIGSPGQTRTADKLVNSQLLYRLSYRGPFRELIYTKLQSMSTQQFK